jgi:predicted enzyme related to lactoylglutathione lyase
MEMEHNPVGWFEIPVVDLDRAVAFYEHVFQITMVEQPKGRYEMAWFPMKEKAYGACGTLIMGEGQTPSPNGVLVYFSVPDVEATLMRVEERGARVLQRKTSIGEFGFIGVIVDTEGNRIGLHSRV